ESFTSKLIKEARRKAKEDAESGSIFNVNTYKIPTQNYNNSDLQSYLPTVILARRAFDTAVSQLKNPRVNSSDPYTYELLRQQNRIPPIRLLRKDIFRAKSWLRDRTGKFEAGDREYERVKRAVDEQDTQCLLLSRSEDQVLKSSVKVAVRNTQAVVDAIDDFLDVLPQEEVDTAKLVAETKKIQFLRLPATRKANATADGDGLKKSVKVEEISPGADLAKLRPDLAPRD
ncbi:unnamed protein product, partial [Prorocentrum cordatum]